MRQKRPIKPAKETYQNGKRVLSKRQKSPIKTAKETYQNGKRDLQRLMHLAGPQKRQLREGPQGKGEGRELVAL